MHVWKLRFFFFFSPLWEGNSPAASQGVTVPHFTVPSFIRDKSPTQQQHSGAAQGYCSVLKHLPWQKAGGTLTETKRASGRGRTNLCCSYCQKHHTLRTRSSFCEHRAGLQSPYPFSLGLHQAQLGSTHRVNHKMLIKGITALTAFHWATPC